MWLVPLLCRSPKSIPSSYLLADVFLAVDAKLDGNLLTCKDKKAQAIGEGNALRDCWSYLRLLYRICPRFQTKTYVCVCHSFCDGSRLVKSYGLKLYNFPSPIPPHKERNTHRSHDDDVQELKDLLRPNSPADTGVFGSPLQGMGMSSTESVGSAATTSDGLATPASDGLATLDAFQEDAF